MIAKFLNNVKKIIMKQEGVEVLFVNNQPCSGLFQVNISLHENQQVADVACKISNIVEHSQETKSSETFQI